LKDLALILSEAGEEWRSQGFAPLRLSGLGAATGKLERLDRRASAPLQAGFFVKNIPLMYN
jgi:hypothetical protein